MITHYNTTNNAVSHSCFSKKS